MIDQKKASAYLVRMARIGITGAHGSWFLVSGIGWSLGLVPVMQEPMMKLVESALLPGVCWSTREDRLTAR